MKSFVRFAACLAALTLIVPQATFGHEGHDHGAAPGAESMSTGPITLTEEASKNIGIQTMEADLVPLQNTLELVGRIQALPERQAKISPRAEGRVTEILVKIGDPVKVGQPVLRFQPITVGNPAVTLSSPIAGYVTRQDATIGQSLTTETVLMEIADYRQVLARAFMFEGPEMSQIKQGQPARVRLDAFPNDVFEGEVQRLDVGLESDSRTFDAYVLLDNPDLKLRPNMFATVNIALGEPQDALAVPRQAILGEMGNLFVFVQDDDTFERRNVVLGTKAGDQVEILEGVLPGDKVVIQGNYQLQFAYSVVKKAAAPAPNASENGKAAADAKPAEDDGHAPVTGRSEGAQQMLTLLNEGFAHLPVWAWVVAAFALGGFVFGFLLRRTA